MSIELALLTRVSFRGREITAPRLRDLLALLAADPRTGASTARLVAGLWPEERPENPAKAVRILVSRARSLLGTETILSTPAGYRLALPDERVDASALLLRAAESLRHARAGDHTAALASAEAGLALWDGADGQGAGGPLAELRAERAAVHRALARGRAFTLARLGRHAEAFDRLAELAGEHPRDEEILLELLRCEAATHGPAVALSRYDAHRRALRDDLGADPGEALRELHHELLREQAPVVRHNVPYEPNPLLGRDDDIAAVTALLRTSRVTSIVGPGGLGKTRLAHVVSRRAEQRTVHLVELAGVGADDDVAGEVASALGAGAVPPGTPVSRPASAVTRITESLGGGPALLVLDNCEHVLDGVADLVGALVSLTRDLRVLTTSRAPLGLSSESVYRLPELGPATAAELFAQRARAARPGVDLPARAVADLCAHLDGLPLAVELAASRVRVMSVAEIARRLSDRFGLLRGGPRDAPRRHRTLNAVVDWSWNLLDAEGQAAMRVLSVFPGGFTAEAAARILGAADGGGLPEVLERLVDHSLLKVAETPLGTRFRMLETVREFGAARRDEAGETGKVLDGFLAWAKDVGMRHHAAVFGEDSALHVDLVRADQDNLVHALRHALARDDAATAVAVSAVLAGVWTLVISYARLGELVRDVSWPLSHFRPADEDADVTRATATLFAAHTYMVDGFTPLRALAVLHRLPEAPPDSLPRAVAALLRALTVRGASPSRLDELCESDAPLLAAAANGVASYVWEHVNDPDRALAAARKMRENAAGGDDQWLLMQSHSRVGELCLKAGKGHEARDSMLAVLRTGERIAGISDVARTRWGLAQAAMQIGEVDEAEHWLDMGAVDDREDAVLFVTFVLGMRAEIRLVRGDVDGGLELWRRAVDRLPDPLTADVDGGPYLEGWALEVDAAAVVAHVHHGRPELVAGVVATFPGRVTALTTAAPAKTAPSIVEIPVLGAALLALASVDLDRARRTGDGRAARSGARLTALAERCHYLRNFQPTMSEDRARRAAVDADGAAYSDDASVYAALDVPGLYAAAREALRERP